MTNANDQSRLDQTGSMVAPEPGGASGQVGGDAGRAGATAPAHGLYLDMVYYD